MIFLLIVIIFIVFDMKGFCLWLILGLVSLQLVEFVKFVIVLVLVKFMNVYLFNIKKWKCFLFLVVFILFLMLLIILQKEIGLVLVYFVFFLVLYCEGMFGVVLFLGVCVVVYFVVGICFDQVFIVDMFMFIGEFVVLLMIFLFVGFMVWVYRKKWEFVWNMIGGSLFVLLIVYFVFEYFFLFNLVWVEWGFCVVIIGYLFYLFLSEW